MPVKADGQEQKQAPVREDRVSQCVELYPVFCTVNIPPKILDQFIDEAYEGWFDLIDEDAPGPAPCILQTTDLDSITHGSRKPMPEFESPFLNKTDDEIREWMKEHRHPNFAQRTFTVLDQNTVQHKISRIGYVDDTDPDDRMLWSDFYVDLHMRMPIEMCTIDWDDSALTGLGTEKVFNRKVIEERGH